MIPKKAKRIIVFTLSCFLILATLSNFLRLNSRQKLKIGRKIIEVEVADTHEKKRQGLSDRESLCSDCGLLFVYDKPGIYSFWMRRMHFDIDIIWIRNKKVMEITSGAKVPSQEEFEAPKTTYQSKEPVDMILEVNSGWAEKNGIGPGTEIIFPY